MSFDVLNHGITRKHRIAAESAASAAAASALQLAAGTASPAGTYANLTALNTTDPDHSKIYITLDDGNWCYHNGVEFVAGGVYQAASVVGDIASINSRLAEMVHPLTNLANGKFDNETGWSKSNVTTTLADNIVTIVAALNGYYSTTISTTAGHVYLAKFSLKTPNGASFRVLNGLAPYTNYLTSTVNGYADKTDVYRFFTASETSTGVSVRFVTIGAQTFELSNVNIIDVTDLLNTFTKEAQPFRYLFENFPGGYLDGTRAVPKHQLDDVVRRLAVDAQFQQNSDSHIVDIENVTLKKIQIVSNCDDGSFVHVSGAGSIADDTTNYRYGTKAVKITAPSGGSETIQKSIGLDVSGMSVIINAYIPNLASVKDFYVYFYTEGMTSNFYVNLPVFHSSTGWNRYVVPVDSFDKSATAATDDLKDIRYIRIAVVPNTGYSTEVTLDMIGLVQNPLKRGKIVLTFDDNQDGVWAFAKPAMDKYGFRGAVYTIKDLVGATNFMTLEQLKVLYEMGWDISTHGQVELDTLATPETIRAELHKNYDYLMDNGFVRSAKHYATPVGKFNDMAMLEIKKIFVTHRNTKFRYNGMPISDKYQLGNLGGNNSTLDALKVYADTAERYKALAIINWHQLMETPSGNEGSASVFADFMDYLATKNIDVVTLSDIFNPCD